MRYTKIVTTFLKNQNKILILKRSQKVKTMKGLWSGISGIIENNEKPIKRAEIEIFEEVGIKDNEIKLLKIGEQLILNLHNTKTINGMFFHFYLKQKLWR